MKTLLLVTSLLLSAPAMAADCFISSAVTGFESNGKNSVIVQSVQGRFQVDTFLCFDLEWAEAIAFKSWSGGPRICKGDDLLIVDQFSGSVKQECKIDTVTKL